MSRNNKDKTPVIAVDEVSMVFTTESNLKVHALENIRLSVEEGSFVTILGPSGSGKSTLLRLMEGLIQPTKGVIRLKGTPVTGPDRRCGMVFQDYSLLPWRTILDNVCLGLEFRNIDKKERKERAMQILENFHLEEFAKALPHELSGGMQQRAAIARTVATKPEILLMDEPFGALDAFTRIRMQEELISFWLEEMRTVLFVTHSVEEAIYLGTRVIILSPRPGRIHRESDIDLSYPRDRYSLAFQELNRDIMEEMIRLDAQYSGDG